MSSFLNVALDGTAYGMVLFIIAVGMSLTLGLMRFVNLSHGAFAMFGGYLTAILIREANLNFFVSFLIAVLATAFVGALLEIVVLRHLYARSQLDQVLFTIGLSGYQAPLILDLEHCLDKEFW